MNQPTRLFDFPYYQLANRPLEKMLNTKINGEWKSYSTQGFIDDLNKISRGLLRLGVKPGEKVALISHNNRMEWNVMDHGILQIGAIDVPIYPTMTPDDYEYILNHSEAKYCFVSNDEIFQKVSSIKDKVPGLIETYTFEDVKGAKNWTEVLDLGEDKSNDAELDALKAGVVDTDLATLIYTSGTTGLPKGVMLTHRNIASNALGSCERLPVITDKEYRCLSFLPVCHIYERMLHYLYMYNSANIYFAESLETIKEDIFFVKPHVFSAVPRLLEKFHDGIVAKGKSAGGVKAMIFNWAVDTALEWEPEGKGGWYNWKLKMARKLVFSKVREALGLTEIMAVASGSAALQPRLARFFNAAEIPVFEGYGLTETSPVVSVNTMNKPGMLKIGSVGKLLKDVEVKIAEDGEILCKGPNVMMGYYKDEEKTNEVLKDGWFHTGDIGVIENGFLRITDRKKEIFKTSGGKYVAPQLIENAMKASLFIEQIMVVGESQKHPSALIVPSFDSVKTWCKRHSIEYTTPAEMIQNEKVIQRIQKDIESINEQFGQWEQIKKVKYLSELFTVESGELTPTLKLKRKPIMAKYADIIASIYE
ncbi:MAG: long-chain fatty acid--CoA ligase [Flavobacteriales bacterium]|jgi:long-chain acyl-CoA synthetase|nr:long-chain fatty acid--CoA ligase [Flavobacteriales bacterium]